MSSATQFTSSDPLFGQPAAERPVYSTGMLLDAQDFLDEQTYHRGRLARAMMFLAGGGTLAGLRTTHQTAIAEGGVDDPRPEEIRVEPGIAVDRLGRLIELPRPACLRLPRWFAAEAARDEGDSLLQAAYTTPERFLSARAIADAAEVGAVPVPTRAIVADVFLRFVACPRGLTPSFSAGPFDALNAVSISRLRDAYELQMVARVGLDDDFDGLPLAPGGVDAATIANVAADPADRRAALQSAVLNGFPTGGNTDGSNTLAPGAEHPLGVDPSAVFIARVLIPVAADDPTTRNGDAVLVDNYSRRFLPSAALLAHWNGL